jgi:predicted O-linked N-acetylglucosamine transferase (SPINDLY family)
LPDTGFVFCCFNSSFKITPEIFDLWMRLLNATPDSVLWLLEDNPLATNNLKKTAKTHGVAPERLVFARHLPVEEHIARLSLADLALDTFPYGAHTTASDAVWRGVPLVTMYGASFAARVAASVLTTAGLRETVTHSAGEYERCALRLARDRASLAALREKLKTNRAHSRLFDTAAFTRALESAFASMYERHQRGLPPVSFSVPE